MNSELNNIFCFQNFKQDVNVNGYNLDKGTEIRLINYVPHVSSDHYLDPRTFNPDRFLKENLVNNNKDEKENEKSGQSSWFQPFGYGSKICLGQRLAQIEGMH